MMLIKILKCHRTIGIKAEWLGYRG